MSKDIIKTQGMTTKMRIKLFDPESHLLISDRLLEQSPELMKGPKESHNGPLSIELNLLEATQVDAAIEYLKKLKGDLPVGVTETSKKATTKKITDMLKDKEPLIDLLKACKSKCKTQEELINYLREYQFKFVAGDVITDLADKDMIVLKELHAKEWQFMVRLVKEAKEPANDKYDFRLVFGIKIVGDKLDKVLIYLWGKLEEKWRLEWKEKKKMNFKKVEKIYIFPEFMDYNERKRWRSENRKYLSATKNGAEPDNFLKSKFYTKWEPYIKVH